MRKKNKLPGLELEPKAAEPIKEYLCKHCGLKGAMEKGGFCSSECFEKSQWYQKEKAEPSDKQKLKELKVIKKEWEELEKAEPNWKECEFCGFSYLAINEDKHLQTCTGKANMKEKTEPDPITNLQMEIYQLWKYNKGWGEYRDAFYRVINESKEAEPSKSCMNCEFNIVGEKCDKECSDWSEWKLVKKAEPEKLETIAKEIIKKGTINTAIIKTITAKAAESLQDVVKSTPPTPDQTWEQCANEYAEKYLKLKEELRAVLDAIIIKREKLDIGYISHVRKAKEWNADQSIIIKIRTERDCLDKIIKAVEGILKNE